MPAKKNVDLEYLISDLKKEVQRMERLMTSYNGSSDPYTKAHSDGANSAYKFAIERIEFLVKRYEKQI